MGVVGDHDLTDMTTDVEVGVVDPDRATAARRHSHEFASQKRDGSCPLLQHGPQAGQVERLGGLDEEEQDTDLFGHATAGTHRQHGAIGR
ncbi:MAG: hypothetical protein V9G19_02970 [Tetrasphaera sp.]